MDESALDEDLLLKFLSDSPAHVYDGRGDHSVQLGRRVSLSEEYFRKLYDDGLRRGVAVYSDANSSLRFTYGSVSPLAAEAEGSDNTWYSTPGEYLNLIAVAGQDDITPQLKALMMKDFWGRWGFKVAGKKHRMVMDFLSDNDFVDGLQGGPVLDGQGHLIGIVSGGSPVTKAGSAFYIEGQSKSVCTDIHLVLWYLEKGLKLKRIAKEFEII